MVGEEKNNAASVNIIIATHKKYRMPTDPMYLPLYGGAEGRLLDLDYAGDNTGDNISRLNPFFCELTGLYWAWKNLDADYIGLVHYRRHFSMEKGADSWSSVLSYEQIKPYLGTVKIFTPNKRKYYIETLYNHYKHTHYSSQLDETRRIIGEKYPRYLASYDRVLKRTYGYMFNMMIVERGLLDNYCSWLFDILFELGRRTDISGLSAFQKRFYGRISEIIFNVWLDQKIELNEIKEDEIMEIPCIHMERINWWRKGTMFLKAKFLRKKYEGSF